MVAGSTVTQTLVIARLGHQGDGVAEGPIFVTRALPGEVVEGEVENGRMAAPRIVTPSTDRVAAPCRHYRTCGGCALQHARNDLVAEFKCNRVREALAAQGIAAEVRLVHVSPPGSRRRAVFSGRRTKKGATLGFHAPRGDLLTSVPDCLVVTPRIRAAQEVLEGLVARLGTRRGEMRVTVTEVDAGLDVDLAGIPEPDAGEVAKIATLLDAHAIARLTWEGETLVQATPPRALLDGIAVDLPPRAFLQATADAQAVMSGLVKDGLKDVEGPVVDLFSGVGTFALTLARSHQVHAVEGDRAALKALHSGWKRAPGLSKVTVEPRDLFRRPLLPAELAHFSAAVIDPPRAGAAAQIVEIVASHLRRLVHVSCNPVTFARDARTLIEADFVMGPVAVIDQFRWSAHVELVAVFSR